MNNNKEISQIKTVLLSIDNKTPVFFNITLYEKMGLVYARKIKGRYKFFLTSKGKQILKTF